MEAFATIEDLALRWRTFTEDEEPMVSARLMDASAYIRTRLANEGITVDPEDDVQAYNLKWVTCNVARRSLSPTLDAGQSGGNGFTQAPLKGYMQTAGAFTEQFQFENPMGDMYLLKEEEKALGLGRMRLKIVPVHMEDCHVG